MSKELMETMLKGLKKGVVLSLRIEDINKEVEHFEEPWENNDSVAVLGKIMKDGR